MAWMPGISPYISWRNFFSCLVADQAALHGLLAKIRNMNLKLISVIRFEPELDENEVGLHENEK
jgi:hypothetical protein